MKRVDREALARAIEQAREESPETRRQIDAKLESDGWEKTAAFAAYGQQCRVLQLLPWEWPPCWLETDTDVESALAQPEDHTGRRAAAELVKQLARAGLSRYEPSPVEALQRAAHEAAQS
jgi:hypothetical protein